MNYKLPEQISKEKEKKVSTISVDVKRHLSKIQLPKKASARSLREFYPMTKQQVIEKF